ncbi:ankyrin repeat domain-containing protein [Sebaldella sp. S0638]|uniref:ankyrin repeat domain-containing protein n=1 Tax=Sebaldella sp. S0638 TaxID=2957809 RepID=UPI00209F9CCD|nr:ankyrin repeat domain-containing protein [Sebaldella sp. S0638]MCP1226129.1 ankyrin repeat domain-containing protein [Sebaldella sp. S0638]
MDKNKFPVGEVSNEFLEKLFSYVQSPIYTVRDCFEPKKIEYNGEIQNLGFLEIRVLGENGVRYAAPDLIFYYIIKYGYKPPQEFIEAVLYGPDPKTEEYKNYMLRYREEFLWGESEEIVRKTNDITTLIYTGDIEKLKNEMNKNINMVSKEGSFLNAAIKADQVEIAKYLISQGININKFNGQELNTAIRKSMNEVVELLLNKNIKIDTRVYALNPLFTAVQVRNYEAAKLLIMNGLSKNTEYTNEFMKEQSPLKIAQKRNDKKMLDILNSL